MRVGEGREERSVCCDNSFPAIFNICSLISLRAPSTGSRTLISSFAFLTIWYTCRHTTASRLVIGRIHITLVQTILGHRTLAMTFRYAHPAVGHLLAEIEKIVPERRSFFGG